MKSDYLWQVILSPLSPQPTYSFLFQEKTFSKDAVLKRLCFGGILLYFSHYWSEKKQNKHSVVTSIFHQLFQNPRKETRCAIIFFSKSCLKRPNNIVVKCLSLVCCSQKLNKNQQSYDTHDIWLIAANFRKALAVFSYYKKKKSKNKNSLFLKQFHATPYFTAFDITPLQSFAGYKEVKQWWVSIPINYNTLCYLFY